MPQLFARQEFAGAGSEAPEASDAQIAADLGISKSRVWQLRLRAMAKIKQAVLEDPDLRELAEELCGVRLSHPTNRKGTQP